MKTSEQQFLELYNQGMKDSEISRTLGVSESSINSIRRKLNLPPNGRTVISDELFFDLYYSGLSDKEISQKSGASNSQIRRRREKYNLPINKSISNARKVLEKYFEELYFLGKNDYEIAEILNLGKTTVQKYRNELKLKPVEKATIDLDKLESLFSSGKSDEEIAQELKYSSYYVRSVRLKLGLKREEVKTPIHYSFNEEEFQVILGSLLGDGSLVKPHKNGRAILTFSHYVEQEEYIKYKQSLLSNICNKVNLYNKYDNRLKVPKYQQFSVYSKSIIELAEIHKRWYTPMKNVCYEDVKNLGPLGLAIWYMDDGYKNKPYGGCTLCTNCFNTNSLEILKEVLQNNFNIYATSNQSSGVLYIPSSEFPKFKKIVEPYIVPCLNYKVSS